MCRDLHKQREFVLNTIVQKVRRKAAAGHLSWNSTKTHAFTRKGWKKIVCRKFFLGAVNINRRNNKGVPHQEQ
jgi:hypothetical protein